MKKVEMTEMSYDEFEEIVKRVYGATKYSFVATEECGNDSSHTFEVTEKEPLDEWDTKSIAEFIEKKGFKKYVNYTLFKDLVNRGELAPGQYLVNVCW
jgi:hypothetical protein